MTSESESVFQAHFEKIHPEGTKGASRLHEGHEKKCSRSPGHPFRGRRRAGPKKPPWRLSRKEVQLCWTWGRRPRWPWTNSPEPRFVAFVRPQGDFVPSW